MGASQPRITSRILLNKWQRQQENDYQCHLEEEEYWSQCEEERYEKEQAESYWRCLFFRHCWNEGLRLPTKDNCPKCNNQCWEYMQSQVNHRSVQDCYQSNDMDRRIKNEKRLSVHDRLGKRVHNQNWADREEKDKYVWQDGAQVA